MKWNDCARKKWRASEVRADIQVYLDGDDTPEGMVLLLTARSSTKRTSGFTNSARPSATRCLWAGVDLRNVQQWLGHSDMESTMRYLKPSRGQQVRDKVNEIFA
jgi:integrase